MRVPCGSPVRAWVYTPVAVPPSGRQFVVGDADVPQHVPRAVIDTPDTRVAPMMEVLLPTEVMVGVVTEGRPTTNDELIV